MKKEFLLIIFCFIIITFLVVGINFKPKDAPIDTNTQQDYRTISDTVQKGETAIDIFRKHNLDPGILFEMKEACADIYKLGEVYPDHRYKIALCDMNRINSFDYWIDDDSILNITRTESGFSAEKIAVEYEKRIR